ncbi:uncharacterized protein J4E88_003839 [Alternaria novae-zelandiae]|uniref:uncharacterized protein n=1 Tax=Alternaria novae-zelandiae TaxID=430562 RepID=UPI0020C2F3FD|nr:uncharacterized protein J4E88_003839 [Alternaria novae-zelandiae]KAI4686002.1 hypothetical protein J4E88_003839 [Alternaria novae-zelandiae]
MARREDQRSMIGSTLLNSCVSNDKQGQVNVTTEDIVPMMTVGAGRTWVRVAVILEEGLTSGPPRTIDGTIDSDPIPRTVGNVTILGLYLRYHAVGVLGANKISGARVRSIEVVETLPRSQIRGDRLISGTLRMPRSLISPSSSILHTHVVPIDTSGIHASAHQLTR